MRTRFKSSIFVALLVLVSGCASAPPSLSPAAVSAFNNHRVQRVLDLVRDTATDGNAATPPVFSTDATRKVVAWHRSAITVVHTLGTGWQATLNASLDELVKNLPPNERQLLATYVALAKTVINEVTK